MTSCSWWLPGSYVINSGFCTSSINIICLTQFHAVDLKLQLQFWVKVGTFWKCGLFHREHGQYIQPPLAMVFLIKVQNIKTSNFFNINASPANLWWPFDPCDCSGRWGKHLSMCSAHPASHWLHHTSVGWADPQEIFPAQTWMPRE